MPAHPMHVHGATFRASIRSCGVEHRAPCTPRRAAAPPRRAAPPRHAGSCSPASTATSSRFSAGGNGHVACGV